MKNVSFLGSKVREGHFTNTVLIGASFSDVDLSGTMFHNCDLSKADFSSAVRYEINPQTNKVKKTKFSLSTKNCPPKNFNLLNHAPNKRTAFLIGHHLPLKNLCIYFTVNERQFNVRTA